MNSLNSLISYNELLKLVASGVIEGTKPEDVNAASIDIHLGRFLLIEQITDGCKYPGHPDVVSLRKRDSLKLGRHDLVEQGPYIIKPGEFLLASSEEVFNLPNNIAAEYKLKSSLARVGLDHLNAGWCFTGDTEVALLNGTTQAIKDLVGKTFWVYSVDTNGKIVPGYVSEVFETKRVTELVEITLDTGASFCCTPEHRIMLRDGTYKAAEELVPGQSLMPLYRKVNQGKELFLDPSYLYRKVWKHTHRMVYETLEGIPARHSVVHHIDHNSKNNSPDNLVCMDRWTHLAQHNTIRNQSPSQREAASKAMAETNKKLWEDKEYRERQTAKNKELARKLNEKQWNHSVKAINPIQLPEAVPVYDMTVEKHHNFALGCGVFVHNCDPGWHGSVLTLELRNLTTYHYLELRHGLPIGQMIFFRCEEVPAKGSYATKGSYNGDRTVQGVKSREADKDAD